MFYPCDLDSIFELNRSDVLFLLFLQVLQQLCQRAEDISNSEYTAHPNEHSHLLFFRTVPSLYVFMPQTVDAWLFKIHIVTHFCFNSFFFMARHNKLADSSSFRLNLIFIHSVKEDVFFFLPQLNLTRAPWKAVVMITLQIRGSFSESSN